MWSSWLPIFSFLMLSGRTVMYPIYKGTYERGNGTNVIDAGASAERDVIGSGYRGAPRPRECGEL